MERVKKIITKDMLNKLRYLSLVAGISLVALVILNNVDNGNKQKLEAAGGDNQPYSIYIVAGQSNAEGTSSFISQIPSEQALGTHPADDDANPEDNAQIWWEGADGESPNFFETLQSGGTYNPAGWIKSDNSSVDPALSGLINFKDLDQPIPVGQRSGQFGSELSLARDLYDKGKRKIIILKVTYGFQTLAKSTSPLVPYDWYPDIPNGPNQSTRNKSYTHLLSAYDELTTFLKNRGDKYTVDGFFWLQGETDTLDRGYTDLYKENFDLLVNRTREDLHFHPRAHFVARKFNLKHCLDDALPRVDPYCIFAFAVEVEGVGFLDILNALELNELLSIPSLADRVRTIRNDMQEISDKYDWVDMVETDDAPFASDNIHLNASGQLLAGKRMLDVYEQPYYPDSFNACPDNQISNNLMIDDYDCDGILNYLEDNGRGVSCPYTINGVAMPANYTLGNGNLGDDDSDCDGYPDYIDSIVGIGSGLVNVKN